MKRIYIAIFFLAVSIGLCVFEQYTVKVTYENATEYIDTAISQLDSKDYDGIEKSCTSLSNYWDKMYPYLTAMSEHDMLDEASITINSLCDMSKNKSDELENELITAKNQIKSIYDNQRITFGNIF